MSINHFINWFSGKQETIENAQEFYRYDLFNPAAVFELPEGGYVLAYIKEQSYPPHETAQNIEKLIDYKMISCCDPLLGIWKPYNKTEVKHD